MPHTSSTGTVGSSSARTALERRSQTPRYCGRFFAMQFATFASVFVGAILDLLLLPGCEVGTFQSLLGCCLCDFLAV